jgi:L-lactate permease
MSESSYRYGMIQSTTPVVLFLLSIPIAFLWSPTAALLSWILTVPIGVLVDRRQRSQEREELDSAMAPPGG